MRAALLRFLIAPTLAAAGCLSASGATPALNVPDARVPPFDDVKQWDRPQVEKETLEWRNPHASAQVTFFARLGAGTASVRILDGEETEVWSASATGPGDTSRSGTTGAGEPGMWRIERMTAASSGTLIVSLRAD